MYSSDHALWAITKPTKSACTDKFWFIQFQVYAYAIFRKGTVCPANKNEICAFICLFVIIVYCVIMSSINMLSSFEIAANVFSPDDFLLFQSISKIEVIKWVITFLIGVCTGLVSIHISFSPSLSVCLLVSLPIFSTVQYRLTLTVLSFEILRCVNNVIVLSRVLKWLKWRRQSNGIGIYFSNLIYSSLTHGVYAYLIKFDL